MGSIIQNAEANFIELVLKFSWGNATTGHSHTFHRTRVFLLFPCVMLTTIPAIPGASDEALSKVTEKILGIKEWQFSNQSATIVYGYRAFCIDFSDLWTSL